MNKELESIWNKLSDKDKEEVKNTLMNNDIIRTRGFELVDNNYRMHKSLDIIIPKRSTKNSAGYDICTPINIHIKPFGVSELIFTDIKAYMLKDEYLSIHVRSSIGMKKGLVLANATGIIDSDYYSNTSNDGNIGFKLRNLSSEDVYINAGERILQGIFSKYLVVDDDKENRERSGGIGSTNI